jgi:oligoendopeptidase F
MLVVTTGALPGSPEAFRDATLEDLLPYYRALVERPLAGEADMERWIGDWSRLEELFQDAALSAEIEYDRDTKDAGKEAAALRFSSEISPQLEPWRVQLGRRLVESGFERPDLEMTIRRWRNRIDLFREDNVPLVAEEERLSSRYGKVVGSMTVEWEGEQRTPPQMRPFAASGDRSLRERAWRTFFRPYIEHRDVLADIFDRLYEVRQEIARNAGFDNYRDFAHQQKNRFDYTPEDSLRYHDAVERTVVPAVERIYRRRARVMGLPGELRPWDAIDSHVASPDPRGRPPIRPFTDQDELVGTAQRVFAHVDPQLGEYFQRLIDGEMLDLMARPGKRPGGYCATLPFKRLPFIFMNSSGIANDVDTLLHEAGHGFHAIEALEHLPYLFQRHPGSEMAEVASMSMELLGAPYLEKRNGGFYTAEEYRRHRAEHLEESLVGVVHIATVDAFQHWIYTSGQGGDAAARDARWLAIRERFQPGIDWSGCEAERIARWYEQLHFFSYPFYYIEYGIAQMGALQVWRNALSDQAGAVAAYREALALGGTRPLPELFARAGAKLVFSAEDMAPLVELVEEELSQFGE